MFKKSQKPYFGAISGIFCPYLGKNEFSWKKGLSDFRNSNYLPLCQKSEKTKQAISEENTELTDRQTNGDFIGPSVGRGSKKQQRKLDEGPESNSQD